MNKIILSPKDSQMQLWEKICSEVHGWMYSTYDCYDLQMGEVPEPPFYHTEIGYAWSMTVAEASKDWDWVRQATESPKNVIRHRLYGIGINDGGSILVRESPCIWTDPCLLKHRRIGYYGWTEIYVQE